MTTPAFTIIDPNPDLPSQAKPVHIKFDEDHLVECEIRTHHNRFAGVQITAVLLPEQIQDMIDALTEWQAQGT